MYEAKRRSRQERKDYCIDKKEESHSSCVPKEECYLNWGENAGDNEVEIYCLEVKGKQSLLIVGTLT